MGSLSPKTRNSQVGLYQSGDVDYLIATDAIGMGLNMDINEIYFSNLKKFDGKKTRRLNLIEMSQIAGRAGRYKNDGGFGTTGDCETLNSDEIEKGTKFDVMLSTFVLQHITYKNPSAWNVSDIVNKMKEYAHEDTTWILYEHDGEYGGWIDKMFNECGITPEVYQRGYTGIEDHTHRDNSVGNRQGHHLIIWRGV